MNSLYFLQSVLIIIFISVVSKSLCNEEDTRYESATGAPTISDAHHRRKRTLIFLVPFEENQSTLLKRSNRPSKSKLTDRKSHSPPVINNESETSNFQKLPRGEKQFPRLDVYEDMKRYATSEIDPEEELFNERRPYYRMVSVKDRKTILNKLANANFGKLRKRGSPADTSGNRIALIVGKEIGKPTESKKTRYNCFCQAKDGDQCKKHAENCDLKKKKNRSVRITNVIDDDDLEIIDVDDENVIPIFHPGYYIQNFQIIPEMSTYPPSLSTISRKKLHNPLRDKSINVPHLFPSTQNPESISGEPEEPTKINIPFATHVNFDQRVFLYDKKQSRRHRQKSKLKPYNSTPEGHSKDVPPSVFMPLERNFANLDECVKLYGTETCADLFKADDENEAGFDFDINKYDYDDDGQEINDYVDNKDVSPAELPIGEVADKPSIISTPRNENDIEDESTYDPTIHEVNQDMMDNAQLDNVESSLPTSTYRPLNYDDDSWKTPTKYYDPQNRIIDYIKNHKTDENPDNFKPIDDPGKKPTNSKDITRVKFKNPYQKLLEYFEKLKTANSTSKPPTPMVDPYQTIMDILESHKNDETPNATNSPNFQNWKIPQKGKDEKENGSLDGESQPASDETSTLSEGAFDETSPTYLGKLVPTNPQKLLRTRDLSDLEDSDLFYAGGGVKLPLTIRKLRDGSFALAVSDKACKHFLRGNCPSCRKDKDGRVAPKLRYSADTVGNAKRYPIWSRKRSMIKEKYPEKTIHDSSEISSEDTNGVVKVETDRNPSGNEFLLKLLNVDEIPNDSKTEIAMTAIDDMLTFTPKFRRDEFLNDDWASEMDSIESENDKYNRHNENNGERNGISRKFDMLESEEGSRSNGNVGHLEDNPILGRLGFPKDKQTRAGPQRLQRSNGGESSKRTGALRNMLYWMKELILGPPAREDR